MPLRADFVTAHDDSDHSSGSLWGAEYETSGDGVSDLVRENNRPIACALCEVAASDTLMIPGTVECPSGWLMEYNGYVMANHHGSTKGEYVCVDRNPTPSTTGDTNANNDRYGLH